MNEKQIEKVMNAISASSDFGELVGHYVDFRDQKEAIKRQYAEDVSVPESFMKRIESRLLELLADTGQESAKTKFGTAYKKPALSAKVADWNVLIDYIKRNDAYDLLVKNVAKDAVKARIDETGEIVPGVDLATTLTVGIRRS